MKIAFVVHDYHRSGGHSRYVAELASRFSTSHEVHVFANTFRSDANSRICFHKVPAWRATALTTVLTFAIPALLRVGRNFDVVHVQGFCGPRGDVITTHICNEAWYRALAKQQDIGLRDRIFHLCTAGLERWLYRGNQDCHVIAVSKRVARDVADLYKCIAPMHVIHHGVDLLNFSPASRQRLRASTRQALHITDDQPVFLFVGQLRKGAKECIRALSQCDTGRLLFVSPSDAVGYRSLARRLGCEERIVFLGSTDYVEQFYAAADALLLPTPYDSFGLVVTEAMACGLPVIVSREAGAAELINHKQNGLLLEDTGSVDQLAGYMRLLAENSRWASQLGVAAHETVQMMSWDAVASKTMQIYEEIHRRRIER